MMNYDEFNKWRMEHLTSQKMNQFDKVQARNEFFYSLFLAGLWAFFLAALVVIVWPFFA